MDSLVDCGNFFLTVIKYINSGKFTLWTGEKIIDPIILKENTNTEIIKPIFLNLQSFL